MDTKIRQAQLHLLQVFAKEAKTFALAGGTALELFYLKHRFSWDLDFFSPEFEVDEINGIIKAAGNELGVGVRLEGEFEVSKKARVRFYTVAVKGAKRSLKLDFVEDVLIERPDIQLKEGIRVYSAENLYYHKIAAIAGTGVATDETGRQIPGGRNEPRDAFDIYMLSKKVMPLRQYLQTVPPSLQKGFVSWYRSFSRQDLKLAMLDLEIYEKNFNARDMVVYIEQEVKQFMSEVIGE